MSKSLEALEELKDEIIPDFALDYEEQEDYNDWIEGLYQTIKQDLEEYEEYKDQWSSDTHCWIEDNIGTFYVIDKDKEIECRLYELPIFNELLANVDKLLYENQELKELQELNKQGLWNLKQENQELKDKIQVLKQSVKDTYDTSQEIIADLKEEKERWRKLCLCWREAYIECDEKFHNLCKEVLGNGNTN